MAIKKTCYFVCRLIDAILSHLIIMSFISFIDAASTPRPPCEKYYFFDDGLRNCEPCRQLCDEAEYRDTVDQCWTLCKAYAELLWPPKTKPSLTFTGPGSQTADSGLPIGATVAIITTAMAMAMLTVAGVFIYRNRQSIALFKRAHTEDSERDEEVELQELNPESNGRVEREPEPGDRQLLTTERGAQLEDGELGELEDDTPNPLLLPTTSTSTESRGNQSGVQEEGSPSFDGAGHHSWMILGRNKEGEVKHSETDMPRCLSPSSGLPGPVSVTSEGHAASSQMCAPELSRIGLTDVHGSNSPSQADPDSTDPKISMA